ncbi:hypothetical protein CBM2599_A120214 [Cupriavidus taiwanensis]|nr:hypothetical protein CBM2599_A120214 [Cupriavidus taiwanensis]SOY81621.1 hypothetical protein CBM2600_A120239 [Cupriavidus taiwanensis]
MSCVLYKSVENATALQQPPTLHPTKIYFSFKSLACRKYFTIRDRIFHHEKWRCATQTGVFAVQNLFPHREKSADVAQAASGRGSSAAPWAPARRRYVRPGRRFAGRIGAPA